jgi:hypothetical protein
MIGCTKWSSNDDGDLVDDTGKRIFPAGPSHLHSWIPTKIDEDILGKFFTNKLLSVDEILKGASLTGDCNYTVHPRVGAKQRECRKFYM